MFTKAITMLSKYIQRSRSILNAEASFAATAYLFPLCIDSSNARGIEILTGVPAGTANEKGEYAPDAVFGKVQKTLMRYLKQYLRLKALASK